MSSYLKIREGNHLNLFSNFMINSLITFSNVVIQSTERQQHQEGRARLWWSSAASPKDQKTYQGKVNNQKGWGASVICSFNFAQSRRVKIKNDGKSRGKEVDQWRKKIRIIQERDCG
jgi:hypothetical protein